MGYIKIWVHLVWATYRRRPLLHKEIREDVFAHIKQNADTKGIYIDQIGGYVEHVHCLISMGVEQSIADIAQRLKGESAYWVNKEKLCKQKFRWQKEYYAVSVCERHKGIVRNYIRNQEAHHQKKDFEEEYLEFVEKYGFEKFWS